MTTHIDRLERETQALLKKLEGACLVDFDAETEIILLSAFSVPLAASDDVITLRLIDVGVKDPVAVIADARRQHDTECPGRAIVAVLVGDVDSILWLSFSYVPLHSSVRRDVA